MSQEQDKAGGGGNRVKSREKKAESTEDKAGTGENWRCKKPNPCNITCTITEQYAIAKQKKINYERSSYSIGHCLVHPPVLIGG